MLLLGAAASTTLAVETHMMGLDVPATCVAGHRPNGVYTYDGGINAALRRVVLTAASATLRVSCRTRRSQTSAAQPSSPTPVVAAETAPTLGDRRCADAWVAKNGGRSSRSGTTAVSRLPRAGGRATTSTTSCRVSTAVRTPSRILCRLNGRFIRACSTLGRGATADECRRRPRAVSSRAIAQ